MSESIPPEVVAALQLIQMHAQHQVYHGDHSQDAVKYAWLVVRDYFGYHANKGDKVTKAPDRRNEDAEVSLLPGDVVTINGIPVRLSNPVTATTNKANVPLMVSQSAQSFPGFPGNVTLPG